MIILSTLASTCDGDVFKSSLLYRSPISFFGRNQFLLGDSAYPKSRFMLTPYQAAAAEEHDNICFNETFSSARVVVEHVMGLLKMRWQSLRGLPIQIKHKRDLLRCQQVFI